MRANGRSGEELERLGALAQEQIDLARAATTREEKGAHLDLAAEYVTALERAARVGWTPDVVNVDAPSIRSARALCPFARAHD